MDSLPLTTRCLICGWHDQGPARETRQRALEHRAQAHPELKGYRRPVTKRLGTFRQFELTDVEKEEVAENRRRRAYLAGIDIEEIDSPPSA